MKKQFFRVKQLADQTFLRTSKTEALSDDLQGAERRIEFIKLVCQNSAKKLSNPNVGLDSNAKEKRLRKNPDYCLGVSMVESASGEEERLLRDVVTDCGKILMCLATSFIDYEIRIESNVVSPLMSIVDNDYPNIMKLKRNLNKLILDMDSARTRYQTALKHHNSSSSSTGGSKVESIKDELEEAETKVEQCRDQLACEMLQLMAREAWVSSTILEYANIQRNYHTAALAILDEIIPEMEMSINESCCRPVFGHPLEEHLKVTGRKIAYPIELCVCALLEIGIVEEGLFRVTAGQSKVRRMKLSLDANCLDLQSALLFRDPHIFTGVLKSYLRELPEPLLTHKLYEQWMAAGRVMSSGSNDEGLNAMWNVVKMLPEDNYNNLRYLIKFFSSLANNSKTNKMSTQNLAIVIAPNLLWAPSEDPGSIGLNMNTANMQNIIVDTLISYADWFFPEEIDFYVTLTRPVLNGHQEVEPNDAPPATPIKRTQSNSSLSDQHSPPHGSPKPAVRVRRQKSAAPNPPVNQVRNSMHDKLKHDAVIEEPVQPAARPEDVRKEPAPTLTTPNPPNHPPVQPPVTVTKPETGAQVPPPITKEQTRLKELPKEGKTIQEIMAKEFKSSSDDRPKETVTKESKPAEEPSSKSDRFHFKPIDVEPPVEVTSNLDRQTSKSGEEIHKAKALELYSTLERKKTGRPVPAPRTTLCVDTKTSESKPTHPPTEVKPSIPQRPANLPRPHSSSFRISRNFDTSPDKQDGDNISLERTYMYSVDKQQVAIVQVNDKAQGDTKIVRERRESGEKPEKPKKPESLASVSTNPSGHQRAASEGSIIDTGLEKLRPPRPTPPPPPVPNSSSGPPASS